MNIRKDSTDATLQRIKPRPTYNPKIAAQWKPVFDRMLDERKTQQVLYADLPQYKPSTIRAYCSDSLRWLIDNEPNLDQRTRYAMLRSMIRITPAEGMLVIEYRNQGPVQATSAVNEEVDYLDKILSWSNNSEKTFFIGGLNLSDENQAAATNLLRQVPDAEYEVTRQYIRAVK